VNLNHML